MKLKNPNGDETQKFYCDETKKKYFDLIQKLKL